MVCSLTTSIRGDETSLKPIAGIERMQGGDVQCLVRGQSADGLVLTESVKRDVILGKQLLLLYQPLSRGGNQYQKTCIPFS
jgi:hypothetical protein